MTGALPGFIFHSENATTYKTIKLTSGTIISSESAPANPAFEKIFQKGITMIGKTRIAISPATMRMIVVESIVPPILVIHFGVGCWVWKSKGAIASLSGHSTLLIPFEKVGLLWVLWVHADYPWQIVRKTLCVKSGLRKPQKRNYIATFDRPAF
jgi:hypothetical protein